MTWRDIPGWFLWREGQEEAVASLPDGAVVVDVGCYLGRSLCSLGELVKQRGKRIRVVGVDWCLGSGVENGTDFHGAAVRSGGGTLAGLLHRNVLACGLGGVVEILVADSARAAGFFADGSVDWCHIDAGHDYDSVRRDVLAWFPKVKSGGRLSGDDYVPGVNDGLVRAVRELVPDARPWLTNQWLMLKQPCRASTDARSSPGNPSFSYHDLNSHLSGDAMTTGQKTRCEYLCTVPDGDYWVYVTADASASERKNIREAVANFLLHPFVLGPLVRMVAVKAGEQPAASVEM